MGDIGSHWCDLVQHVVGQRIIAVLADLSTVVPTRIRPTGSREAFAHEADAKGEAFTVHSEDLATVLLRFDGGAKGCVSIGQVCAGHRNDLWFEASGRTGSLRWRQEQQNELWVGRRSVANSVLPRDPESAGTRRGCLRQPAGRPSGGVVRRLRERDSRHLRRHRSHSRRPQSAGQAAGVCQFRRRLPRRVRRRGCSRQSPARRDLDERALAAGSACGHAKPRPAPPRRGIIVRTRRGSGPAATGETMKLGLFTPVLGKLDTRQMLAKVRALGKVQALELGTGRLAGTRSSGPQRVDERSAGRENVRADDCGRRPDHQRAVLPRKPAASRSPRRRVVRRGVQEDRLPGEADERSRGRHLLRLSRRFRPSEVSRTG